MYVWLEKVRIYRTIAETVDGNVVAVILFEDVRTNDSAYKPH